MSPLFLFTILIPEIIVHDVSLYYQSRAHIYVRVFIYGGLDVKQNQTSHFFCRFDFAKWIIDDYWATNNWFYIYLCSVKPTRKPTETTLFGQKRAENGRNPQWEWKKQYLCRRFRILHFLENHIRVDTIKIIKKCKKCAHFFKFWV